MGESSITEKGSSMQQPPSIVHTNNRSSSSDGNSNVAGGMIVGTGGELNGSSTSKSDDVRQSLTEESILVNSRQSKSLRDTEDGIDERDEDEESNDIDYEQTQMTKQRKRRRQPQHEVHTLTEAETRKVVQWRILALLLIFASGIGVSSMTYIFLNTEENDNHIESFNQFANTIQDITKIRVENLHQGLRNFAEIITGYAQRKRRQRQSLVKGGNSTFHEDDGDEEGNWPMVTIPNFEILAETAREQTQVEFLNFAPLVSSQVRREYEKYTVANQWWINESRNITLKKENTLVETSDYVEMDILGFISQNCGNGTLCPVPDLLAEEEGEETQESRWLNPIWQVSPPPFVPLLINSDANANNINSVLINAMNVTGDSVMGIVFTTDFLTGTSISKEAHYLYHEQFVSPPEVEVLEDEKEAAAAPTPTDEEEADSYLYNTDEIAERPHFIMMTPIFHTLGNRDSDIVGIVISVVTFDTYMADLLPSNVKAVDLIVRSTCLGQAFSYRIDGSKTLYVGKGDYHDSSYDDSVVSIDFQAFLNPDLSRNTPGHCMYTFDVYPTKSFVQSYHSPLPAIFTFVVAAVFSLLIVAFVIFDRMGTRRNAKVEDVAIRTNTIVSQLFPKQVTSQLIKDVDFLTSKPFDEEVMENNNEQHQLQQSLLGGGGGSLTSTTKGVCQVVDLYPCKLPTNCYELRLAFKSRISCLFACAIVSSASTILFAGISGFQEWSTNRDPRQVFNLLEALFSAFDKIASRRGVYKVETMVELYVAVAGVPDANPRHASVMARFASDCQRKSVEVLHSLDPSNVGGGVQDLMLQIGLHTGHVCGGVMRGQRSRFQLFGDSVLTASRIQR